MEVKLKNENRTILVPAGKVYFNDFKNPYTVADTLQFQSASELMKITKDSAYWQLPKDVADNNATGNNDQQPGFLDLMKKYWYFGAGVVVLILLMVYMGKRKKA